MQSNTAGRSARKRLMSRILGLILFVGIAGGWAQSTGGDAAITKFVGAWRLVRLEEAGHIVNCCGMLVFTRDGHMSVQVMQKDAPLEVSAGPEQYSQGGYEASYGTYSLDEQAHTFTFHVEGALVRSLIGKDLSRTYEFTGKQLFVKPSRPEEHWQVVWERY